MQHITVSFEESRIVNLVKLVRLAKEAGKPVKDFVADFLKRQADKAFSCASKGI